MEDFPFLQRTDRRKVKTHLDIEPQEVLLDRLARSQKEREELEQQGSLEVPISGLVFRTLLTSFALVLFVFAGKAFQFQALSGNELHALAQNNAIKATPIVAERGMIYDSSMRQLLRNVSTFDYVCDKRELPQGLLERDLILKSIAFVLSVQVPDIQKRFDETQEPETVLKTNLSQEEIVLLQTREAFGGCWVQENMVREYLYGSGLAHLLGYTAKVSAEELESGEGYFVVEQAGKTGIEKAYEHDLRGKPGVIRMKRNAAGNVVGEQERTEPQGGRDLVLWLDIGLQERLDKAMRETLANTNTQKGAALALNPQTGGILAMVSYPSFDPGMFSKGISQQEWELFLEDFGDPLFNRAIGGVGYPTGSVIKPLVAFQALQEGVIDENTSLFAPLEICVWNKYAKRDECFRDWTFHGQSDVKRAIAESVNTFFYIVGGGYEGRQGLGPEKILDGLKAFGWGQKTGVDLPGEGQGLLPVIDLNWRLGDTYHLSIGQGPFTITPLQVASAFGAIANGGTLFQPQVAKEIIDDEKRVIQEFPPRILQEDLAGTKNLRLVAEGMLQTVKAGSATGFLDGLQVAAAAKTGTAQTGRKTIEGRDYLHSWIVTFAPFEHPEFLLVVVVEDVKEGRAAALPVARDVMQWYFSR